MAIIRSHRPMLDVDEPNMSLDEIDIKPTYRTSDGNLVDDFYIPCLAESTEYRRAVGYFTSSSLALAAKGLTSFIKNDGRMKLVASPRLAEEDINAIEEGYDARRDEAIVDYAKKEFRNVRNEIVKKRLEFLAWMIAHNILDVKLAFVQQKHGFYHEKLGIMEDASGNRIAFSGSSNETSRGMYSNFESIDVYCSWKNSERVKNKEAYFEKLWNNDIQRLDVVDFPEAAEQELLDYKPDSRPEYDPESQDYRGKISDSSTSEGRVNQPSPRNNISIPEEIDLRGYQQEAIKAWVRNEGRGILEMATGTGKTITAMALLTKLKSRLSEENNQLFCVVTCPYQHLVDQWEEEAINFGFDPTLCYVSKRKWQHELNRKITALNTQVQDIVFCIATNATFCSDAFQDALRNVQKTKIVVSDEVHNMGSPQNMESLPVDAEFRLGLSATPARWFDDEGTDALFDYFGEPVFEYGLGKAIENEFLAPYDYHPVLVSLTERELDEYMHLTEQIVQRLHDSDKQDPFSEDKDLKFLLLERARLTANAENKISKLKNVLQENDIYDKTHNLIYCGAGNVEDSTHESESRQIDLVTKMLGKDLGMHVSKYVAETDTARRREILDQFSEGELQGLVAIRCLDEGVDVPETRRAFILASTSNPRQFIQRRGRVLRTAEGKEKATIWDFIVVPPFEAVDSPTFNEERKIIRKELKRVSEFTDLAQNGPQAQRELAEVKDQYNLFDM